LLEELLVLGLEQRVTGAGLGEDEETHCEKSVARHTAGEGRIFERFKR